MDYDLTIDGLLVLIYVMLACALGAVVFSVVRGRIMGKRVNSPHSPLIPELCSPTRSLPTLLSPLLLIIIMIVSWFLGGSVEAMFVDTILIMLLLAVVAVCLSAIHTKFLR